jgi:hypothetical protein
MPRRLPARWQPESIREFRASAQRRFEEGMALAAAGHRTGAIYLWGYTAEMILKAAYFALLGRAETAVLTRADIFAAIQAGRALGIVWRQSGLGHDVRSWAELLVTRRVATPGAAYASPQFGQDVQECGQIIGQLWSEELRYHQNLAYLYEMNQVREAAEWLLAHSSAL